MARTMRQVLVIDDEAAMRHMLRLVLERDGYLVSEAPHGRAGLEKLQQAAYDYILCDIRMPELDGPGFLREKERCQLGGTVIMMSAYGTIDTAVACMQQGAYDYVSKPFRPDEILLALRKAEERLQLSQENLRLRDDLRRSGRPQGIAAIVHRSAVMTELLDTVRRAAASPVPVLVTGETGTGKELVARALHAESPRAARPFLAINCGAIPAGLLESELFGHVRGAFTGADRARTGLFGAADGGTLLLDEIGDLPLELQPKLLRVLQEGEVRRIGDNQSRPVDVRVVAATAVDLPRAVAQGRFREDLFYRLAVVNIDVPPLRRRPEDIAPLVDSYLPRLSARHGRPAPEFAADALLRLEQHPWPGNVRELLNVLEKTLVLCREETITAADIILDEAPATAGAPSELSLKKAVAALERDHICRALAATGGNRTQAARLLEISLRNLLYKIKEHGLHN
jgi:two-component system response regulator AtoC